MLTIDLFTDSRASLSLLSGYHLVAFGTSTFRTCMRTAVTYALPTNGRATDVLKQNYVFFGTRIAIFAPPTIFAAKATFPFGGSWYGNLFSNASARDACSLVKSGSSVYSRASDSKECPKQMVARWSEWVMTPDSGPM